MIKRILAILVLAGPVHAVCSGYANQRALTISTFTATVPQMVTNVFGTVSNFPVLVTTTSVIYSTAAGTGQLLNSNGYDLTYSADASCNTMLNFDTETVITAGIQATYNAWVRVPTLSTATATAATFYQNWGNASITSYVGYSTGVWDSNYLAVYHFPNGTTLSAKDSTSNANNGTINSITASTGVVDGSAKFPSINGDYIGTPSINLTNTFTVESWGNPSSNIGGNYPRLAENDYASGFFLGFNGTSSGGFTLIVSGDLSTNPTWVPPVSFGTWYSVAGTYDGATAQLYGNGVFRSSHAESATTIGSAAISIGDYTIHSDPAAAWGGYIDEVRFSKAVRNSDWLLTSYNTVNSSSTFVSYGAIQTGGTAYVPQNRDLTIQGGKLKIQGGRVQVL